MNYLYENRNHVLRSNYDPIVRFPCEDMKRAHSTLHYLLHSYTTVCVRAWRLLASGACHGRALLLKKNQSFFILAFQGDIGTVRKNEK